MIICNKTVCHKDGRVNKRFRYTVSHLSVNLKNVHLAYILINVNSHINYEFYFLK